jgi:hypothetical protein
MYGHGERVYVQVDFADKKAFRDLGGRYGHGITPFHDMDTESQKRTTHACCWTSSTHRIDPDPSRNDCCTFHDRDYTLFYTQEQAACLKTVDKQYYWRAWYWSDAPVRDDLENVTDITQHLSMIHSKSPFSHFHLDIPTYLTFRQQTRDIAASFTYENPNPGLHERKIREPW